MHDKTECRRQGCARAAGADRYCSDDCSILRDYRLYESDPSTGEAVKRICKLPEVAPRLASGIEWNQRKETTDTPYSA